MKRATPIVLAVLVASVSCTDKQTEKTNLTSPTRSRLSMSTLPAGASTVCVSAVKERDQLVASTVTTEMKQTRMDALDALVEDTCY
jgi:hypothetical protein